MKLSILGARSGSATTVSEVEETPRGGPIPVSLPGGASGLLKVDSVALISGLLVVSGWRVGAVELILAADGRELDCLCEGVRRDDVSEHFPEHVAGELGFVLSAETHEVESFSLSWMSAGQRRLSHLSPVGAPALDEAAMASMGEVRARLLRRLEIGSIEWKALLPSAPSPDTRHAAMGYLESAVSIGADHGVIACGWAVGEPDIQFWLENEAGEIGLLTEASWRERRDVFESVGEKFGTQALESGFVAYARELSATKCIVLKALVGDRVRELHRIDSTAVAAEPRAVSQWLFGIAVSEANMERHHALIEEPVLSQLIELKRASWGSIPRRSQVLGVPVAEPRVSVIVPLYGRYDFVESQMIEWVRDPWFLANAELIYVVDDPAIEAAFRLHAIELFRLYGVAFTWVAGVINRGFSGANNLGAETARADHLLFLNSDVFPSEPGWLEPMLAALGARPDLGVVGPRLIFAEGGIQHAGMAFERLQEYGVWINRHPYSGLAPGLDPSSDLTEVAAVTGACMLVRRRDFDAVDGWDTGYLVGDFEDSDLCLKLRSIGLGSGYLPSVELVHLERQSMIALGGSEYRKRVVLWNAMRHQRRWRHLLDGVAPTEVA